MIPKIGETVEISYKSKGNGKLHKDTTAIDRITHLYGMNRIQVSAGDIWSVKKHPDQSKAQWMATR